MIDSHVLRKLAQAGPLLAALEREESFTKAAGVLAVDQSAVSHRLRDLEELLGIRLFDRTTRRVVPTRAGRILCAVANRSMADWDRALAEIRLDRTDNHIRLSMSSSLATKWLFPVLTGAKEKGLNLGLEVDDALVDLRLQEIDAGLRFGMGPYPGLHSVKVSNAWLQPVYSPSIWPNLADADLSALSDNVPLLADNAGASDSTGFNWSTYYSGLGINDPNLRVQQVFARADLMLQAASSGAGIALGRTLLIEQDIKEGFLARLGPAVPMRAAYWLVCPHPFARDPRFKSLSDWLSDEVKRTVETSPLVPELANS